MGFSASDLPLSSVPRYLPYLVTIYFAVIPLGLFIIWNLVYTAVQSIWFPDSLPNQPKNNDDEEENVESDSTFSKSKVFMKNYSSNIPRVYFRYSAVIAVFNILWSIAILICQGVYIYDHMSLGTDLTYYLKIDIPEYEAVDLVNLAEDSYSMFYYLQGNSVSTSIERVLQGKVSSPMLTELVDYWSTSSSSSSPSSSPHTNNFFLSSYFTNNNHHPMTYDTTITNTMLSSSMQRKLSSSSTSLAMIYHTSDYDNMLLEYNMIAACLVERNLMENVQCVNYDTGTSLLASVFDMKTCEFQIDYEYALDTFTLSDNTDYVADNVDPSDPNSAIISSLFKMGSCQDLSLDTFENEIDAQASYNVEITYLASPFITDAFQAAILNGVYISAIALIASTIYIMLSIRGLLVTLMTLFVIVVSVINAAAVLLSFGYGTFSAFNVLSVFILIGVGGNAVVMFAAAWRKAVKLYPGHTPTVHNFLTAYEIIKLPVLFTVCAAAISLFSKLISPVIIISQLGAFMGVSVLVFYFGLHTLIIPVYITTTWFHFPTSIHKLSYQLFHYVLTCHYLAEDELPLRYQQSSLATTNTNAEGEDQQQQVAIQQQQQEQQEQQQEEEEERIIASKRAQYHHLLFLEGKETFLSRYINWWFGLNGTATGAGAQQQQQQAGGGETEEEVLFRMKLSLNTVHQQQPTAPGGDGPRDSQGQPEIIREHVEPLLSPIEGYGYGLQREDGIQATSPTTTNRPINTPYPHLTPVEAKKRTLYGFRLLRCYGCGWFVVTLCSFLGLLYLIMLQYSLDLGIPQLFPSDSNMGEVLYIVKNYKSSLLTSIDSVSDVTVVSPHPTSQPVISPSPTSPPQPSLPPVPTPPPQPYPPSPPFPPYYSLPPSFPVPTIRPTFRGPTMKPTTNRPSVKPSSSRPSRSLMPSTRSPSFTPTRSTAPTTSIPSYSPSIRPTSIAPPTTPTTSSDYVDYTITCCWGLSSTKQYKDSDVNVSYDGVLFQQYVNSPQDGVVQDMQSFCLYVNSHRSELNINPSWNMTTDCIYNQYVHAYQALPLSYQNHTNALLYWSSLSTTSSKLLGISALPGSTKSNPLVQITWLCSNYSARTYVNSMITNPNVANDMHNTWSDAFANYGSIYANQYGIENFIASNEFSFPLLAQEVLLSIILAIFISVVGFFGLLVMFTGGDIVTILMGTISMIAIFMTAICLHLYFFTAVIDLLDVVVLIAIIGIVVDLPIHMLLHYLHERTIYDNNHTHNNTNNNANNHGDSTLTTHTTSIKKAISPALYDTNHYMRFALFQLLILTLICGIPLLFATFVLLQKTGQYIIIIAIVSYTYSILVLPYLLAIGYRTHWLVTWYTWFCKTNTTNNDGNNNDIDGNGGQEDEEQVIHTYVNPALRPSPTSPSLSSYHHPEPSAPPILPVLAIANPVPVTPTTTNTTNNVMISSQRTNMIPPSATAATVVMVGTPVTQHQQHQHPSEEERIQQKITRESQ